jgi:hypothetical protein
MYVVYVVLLEDLILLQVTTLTDEQTCASSGRRKTTTPTSAWVASLAAPIPKKKPHKGAKELQTTLQDKHNCTQLHMKPCGRCNTHFLQE